MNPEPARQTLALYRPGTTDGDDPEIAQALRAVNRNPELRRWFDQHCAAQSVLRDKFRSLPVPPAPAGIIRANRTLLRPAPWWHQPPVWAAAAALVVLLGVLLFSTTPRAPDQFADFRARMVRTVLREYAMDIRTQDMDSVRAFLARRGGPADYEVPPGLARLDLTGAGLLRWRNHPVSMVCFNRGDDQMLFLFVLDRDVAQDAPPPVRHAAPVNKLLTVSWSTGDKSYLLAGPPEPGFTEKYFRR